MATSLSPGPRFPSHICPLRPVFQGTTTRSAKVGPSYTLRSGSLRPQAVCFVDIVRVSWNNTLGPSQLKRMGRKMCQAEQTLKQRQPEKLLFFLLKQSLIFHCCCFHHFRMRFGALSRKETPEHQVWPKPRVLLTCSEVGLGHPRSKRTELSYCCKCRFLEPK